MTKEQDIHEEILSLKISQIGIDILAYQNAIIEDNGKEPLSEETIAFYQGQINELSLMKQELEKL
jgi:hypothetical protein